MGRVMRHQSIGLAQPLLLSMAFMSLFLLLSAKNVSARDVLPAQKIKNNADDVLAIMALSVVPDLTASFLSFDDAQSGQNRLNMIQVAGGTASAEAASIYARYRAPTGLFVMDRPLRYVLEFASTAYLGDQRGLLGFNNLSSVGAAIEFDSSAKSGLISRTRIVGRYAFGQNVRGFAIGLAVSF